MILNLIHRYHHLQKLVNLVLSIFCLFLCTWQIKQLFYLKGAILIDLQSRILKGFKLQVQNTLTAKHRTGFQNKHVHAYGLLYTFQLVFILLKL